MTRTALGGVLLLGTALAMAVLDPQRAVGETAGDARRGGEIFAAKHCARCHRPRDAKGVGPALEELRRPQGAHELAGRL